MTANPIQVQKFLKGLDYPADKQTLLRRAEASGADENVLRTLRELPADRFNSPNDVSEAMRGK